MQVFRASRRRRAFVTLRLDGGLFFATSQALEDRVRGR